MHRLLDHSKYTGLLHPEAITHNMGADCVQIKHAISSNKIDKIGTWLVWSRINFLALTEDKLTLTELTLTEDKLTIAFSCPRRLIQRHMVGVLNATWYVFLTPHDRCS